MSGLTEAEFARRAGVDRSTVNRWGADGRLVRLPDGSIDEAASRQMVEATYGGRDDVRRRHQESKARPEGAAAVASLQVPHSLERARHVKAVAEARRLSALAEQEEMTRDRMRGNLIPRESVELAMRIVGAAVRGLMEVMPNQVAPLVIPVSDLDAAHELLSERCRDVLARFGEEVERARRAIETGGAA